MRIFYDTEFVERGPQLPIQLISLGMVREDGQELYLINEECLSNVARHPWLSVNVFPWLPATGAVNDILEWDRGHPDYPNVFAFDMLAPRVREFLNVDKPELWAYYGAYDHVVLCQLFGAMVDLPPGVPMYTRDLMQEWDRLDRKPPMPGQSHEHHALFGARWARDFWQVLDTYNEVTQAIEQVPQEEKE
jgi:hypothetical protein